MLRHQYSSQFQKIRVTSYSFRCAQHEVDASLVVEIDVPGGVAWFATPNAGIEVKPLPGVATRHLQLKKGVVFFLIYFSRCILSLHFMLMGSQSLLTSLGKGSLKLALSICILPFLDLLNDDSRFHL